MKLPFSFDDVEPIWIDGGLPIRKSNCNVNVRLAGQSDFYFPRALSKVGHLLCRERPSPLQHAVTLLLNYPYSNVPVGGPPPREGEWSDVPGSTIYRQIRLALPNEAVQQIREVEDYDYGYELLLKDVQLEHHPRQR